MLIMADFISIAARNEPAYTKDKVKREREREGGRERGTRNVMKDNANELKLNGKKNGNWNVMQCAATPLLSPPLPLHSLTFPSVPLFPLSFLSLSAGCCRPWLSVCCQLTLHAATLSVCHLPVACLPCLALPCLSAHLPQVDVPFALLTFCIMSNFMSNVAYA